jgi:F-type H+-transporting ATPase subunit epsilon
LRLDVVTAEREVFSGDVDMVIAPGTDGELGILPHHAALLTTLRPGVLQFRTGGQEETLAIGGGFLEVRDDRVLVLADAAERGEEIDVERARAAEERARRLLAEKPPGADLEEAAAQLRHAQFQLRVAQRRRQQQSLGQPPAPR